MQVTSFLIEAHIFRRINNEIEYLVLKRAGHEKYNGIWQMVTGSIDGNESAHQTAKREIKEETNLDIQKYWVVPHVNSFYSPEKDVLCMVPVFVAEVHKDAIVKISFEHDEYRWVNKEEAIQLFAWPGQREAVKIIHEYFSEETSLLEFIEIK